MTTSTARTASATKPAIELEAARFIDLVTFRRAGLRVGTPVLFVPDGDRLLVRTARESGKLKRIAHTARVELTPADQKGRHLGVTVTGTARILPDDAVAPTLARLHARYRIAGPLFSFVRRMRHQDDVIVEITLDRAEAAESAVAPATAVARRIASTRIGAACLLLTIAAVTAGCGGSASATAGPSPEGLAGMEASVTANASPSPMTVVVVEEAGGLCARFTPEQAAAILGEPVGPGVAKASITFGNESCRYDATGSAATVSLWLHPTSDRSDWEHQVTTLGAKPELAVGSVGEAAFRIGGTVERPRTKVAAFDGGHDFWIDVSGAVAPVKAGDAAVTLAGDLVITLR